MEVRNIPPFQIHSVIIAQRVSCYLSGLEDPVRSEMDSIGRQLRTSTYEMDCHWCLSLMQLKFILFAIVLPVAFASCIPEEEAIDVIPEVQVESALQPYFDTFRDEANARGILINSAFLEIDASIENIREDDVVGECWFGGHGPNEIRIDQQFWNEASDIDREFVVFHELGHCYLDRDHTEASTSDGTCLSIMASGVGDCNNRYSLSTRATYLDELFYRR